MDPFSMNQHRLILDWWMNEQKNPGQLMEGITPELDKRFREMFKEQLNRRMYNQMNAPQPQQPINGTMPQQRFELPNMPYQPPTITGRRG